MPLPVEGFRITETNVRAIGKRRQLFVDDTLIDALMGTARLQLHRPVAREIVLVHDAPWEGNTCAYATIFQAPGGEYRMVYRGSGTRQAWNASQQTPEPAHRPVVCLAESSDGVHWTKPNLDLVSFAGSTSNNILWDGVGSHNFTPFYDTNPGCSPEARYKAVGGLLTEGGLFAFQSPDGRHWQQRQSAPIITQGTFDSQNTAFWHADQGVYRAYIRDFRKPDGTGGDFTGIRDIKTCTSPDFVHWSDPTWLAYRAPRLARGPDQPLVETHLYTNQVMPHPRAPHILLGLPTRFHPEREGLTEAILMASRDGQTFSRWDQALLPPGPSSHRWHNRSNYVWWGMLETPSALPDAEPEISLYANEHYSKSGPGRIRRYTLRRDGFVSVRAELCGGQVLTPPLTFEGSHLTLNVATSAAGDVRVGIERPDGHPVPGLAIEECRPFYGDTTAHTVTWRQSADLGTINGTTVRLRIALRDADLYALQFR